MGITDYAFSKFLLQNQVNFSNISQENDQDKPRNNHLNFKSIDLLFPIKQWLNHLEINDPRIARFICSLVPAQCPFHREIKIFGHIIFIIPPLCKLNPLYDELMMLRFRSLCYLETVS